jgi:hypothetical protein
MSNHKLLETEISSRPYLMDFETSGSGKNGFDGGQPDSFMPFAWNFEYLRRGIVSAVNIEQQAFALGDDHVFQITATVNRGSSDGSGEGWNSWRNQIGQNLSPMVTTANSTLAAGATLIQGTLLNTQPLFGGGQPYIDSTKGGPLFNITAVAAPGASVGEIQRSVCPTIPAGQALTMDTNCLAQWTEYNAGGPRTWFNSQAPTPASTTNAALVANPTGNWFVDYSGGEHAASVKTSVFTVATLPAASTLGSGAQVVVSDATTFTPGTCTRGGSDFMVAVSNGTTWSCH